MLPPSSKVLYSLERKLLISEKQCSAMSGRKYRFFICFIFKIKQIAGPSLGRPALHRSFGPQLRGLRRRGQRHCLPSQKSRSPYRAGNSG